MTYEDRTNLIAEFLSANVGKTDETTTRTLNMLVESLAYSKLQELLPDVFKQEPSAPTQSKEKKKLSFRLTKKEIEQMPSRYRNLFAHGDKIITYRQKPNGVYEARYHRDGIHIEVSSKDLTVLKCKFIEALNNYAATGSTKPKTQYNVLFNRFAEDWLALKEKTTKPATFREYKRLFEHDIAPAFTDKALADIDREFVQNFLFRYVEEGKQRTAQKLQLLLRCIFDVAADDYKIPSPMAKVVLPRYQTKKGNALTYEEEAKLVRYCRENADNAATDAILALLYFGMRQSELATMRVKDGKWLEIETSKERLGQDVVLRRAPFTPMVQKILPLIDFEKARSTNTRTIASTIKRVLPDHHVHELRHTYVSRCKECGVAGEVVSIWVGHSLTGTITSTVYTHYSEEFQRREAEKVNYAL